MWLHYNSISYPNGEPYPIIMKCYFNLVSGDERLIDHEGVEVKDLDQAWVQALKAIEELRAEDDGDASDWADWSLEVADASGAVFFSIKLTASLQ